MFVGRPKPCRSTAMTVVLFTKERAYGAALRAWGAHDAKRLALAIAWERSTETDAHRELSTTLAWHAERAKITGISCKAVATSMLHDALAAVDEHHDAVLQEMIAAAERELVRNRRAILPAALAAADVAEREAVPPALIDSAVRFARWRTRRRA